MLGFCMVSVCKFIGELFVILSVVLGVIWLLSNGVIEFVFFVIVLCFKVYVFDVFVI